MPCSIAACRTVLPFSTVTGRPSMVRLTPFSISFGSYQFFGGRRGGGGARGSSGSAGSGSVRGSRFSPRARRTRRTPNPLLFYLRERRTVPIDVHPAQGALQRESPLDHLVGDANHDVFARAVRVGDRHRDRDVIDLVLLFEAHPQRATVDDVGEAHRRDAGCVDPAIEEALERAAAGRLLHRDAEVVRARPS